MKQIWLYVNTCQSLFFAPVIPLPTYLTKRNENKCPQKDLHQNVNHSFFHSSPYCKQYKYPSTGDWINSLWCIHTMEYSATKRNELLINATTWMNFKDITCWVKEAGFRREYILYGSGQHLPDTWTRVEQKGERVVRRKRSEALFNYM